MIATRVQNLAARRKAIVPSLPKHWALSSISHSALSPPGIMAIAFMAATLLAPATTHAQRTLLVTPSTNAPHHL